MERCSEYDPFAGRAAALSARAVEQKSVPELFSEFYAARSGGDELSETDRELLERALQLMEESEVHEAPTPQAMGGLLDFILEQEGRA